MSDPLLNELQEEVRQEELKKLAKKYGSVLLAILVLAVAGTGGYVFWQQQRAAAQLAATTALVEILQPQAASNPSATADALQAFAANHAGTAQATMAMMLEADFRNRAADAPTALARLQQVMADMQADATLRAVATLAYVQQALESAPKDELQNLLTPLQATGHAFRVQALELGAALAVQHAEKDGARNLLEQLQAEPTASAAAKRRAEELLRVL